MSSKCKMATSKKTSPTGVSGVEWCMDSREVARWRVVALRDFLPQLKKHVSSNRLVIGPKTFATGMTLVMYESCVHKSYKTAEYLVKIFVKDHDINQLLAVNVDNYRPFPSITISDKIALMKSTLVYGAVLGSSVLILKLLVSHGASLDTPNCCKQVPIMSALDAGESEVVSFLLSEQVTLNCSDLDGRTPLMYATMSSCMAMYIPQMVSLGARMDAVDNRGYTALHIAIYEGAPEAVTMLLQLDFLQKVDLSNHPHPFMISDYSNGTSCSSEVRQRKRAIRSVLEDYFSRLSSIQRVDVLLVQATFHLYDCIKFNEKISFFEHKFVEALILKQSLQLTSNLERSTNEIQTYEEFRIELVGLSEFSKIKKAITQAMLIQVRCIGKGSTRAFDFAAAASTWLIRQEDYESGFSILLEMSEMLVHVTKVPNHPSLDRLSQMIFQLSTIIKQVCYHSLSKTAQSQSVPEIELISKQCIAETFDPVFNNIARSLCFLSVHVKQLHSHTISKKSTSLLVSELYFLLKFAITKPEYPINISAVISELVQKSPKVLIDINGNPTTILHLVLITSESDEVQLAMAKLILENGGDYLINAVGPGGNRPIQSTHKQSIYELFIEYGAHLDAVNSLGQSGLEKIRLFISEDLVPNNTKKLSCICSSFIANTLPYMKYNLPGKVKNLIMMHDSDAESIVIKEELVFYKGSE